MHLKQISVALRDITGDTWVFNTHYFSFTVSHVSFKARFRRYRSNFRPAEKFERTLRSHGTISIEQSSYDRETNGNRAIWLVYGTDTNARGFWLVKRMLGWKNFMLRELCRNQPILRFDVMLQHDWPIERCLLHFRIFFGGKTKKPCFDLFIHWLIKQITNTYRNHFSRSYENRSIFASFTRKFERLGV